MNKAIKIATVVSAAIALSGCQSFINKLGFGPKDQTMRAEAGAPIFGSEELAQGRAALKAGNPANAIVQFRLAAMDEKIAPDAFNGMGVAYAKLGRADLAERYFKMAMTLDANNPRYIANLTKFYNSPLGTSSRALAMREAEAEKTLAMAATAAQDQGMLAPVAADEKRGSVTLVKAPVQITRKSAGELRIATRSDPVVTSEAALPKVGVRSPSRPETAVEAKVVTTSGNKPSSGRISFLGVPSQNDSYPVRIKIAKPDSTGATKPRAQQYPVRVALTPRTQAD
jgi:hypothetical protein